jgi:hypothetical protein
MDATPSTADRVEIPPDAFLRLTGQLWKLKLALVLPWPAIFVGYWGFRQLVREQSFNYAVRWLKWKAPSWHGDPSKIGIYLSSSGGQVAELLALRPRDTRYNAIPLPEAPHLDASVTYVPTRSPISDPGNPRAARARHAGAAARDAGRARRPRPAVDPGEVRGSALGGMARPHPPIPIASRLYFFSALLTSPAAWRLSGSIRAMKYAKFGESIEVH